MRVPSRLFLIALSAIIASPAFGQSLIGDGSSSQTIAIGGGAVEISVDLEGQIDTTGNGLPALGGNAGAGVNGAGVSLGRSTPSPERSVVPRRVAPLLGSTERDRGSTCDQLPTLMTLEPAEIAAIDNGTPLVFMRGCPAPFTFSPSAEAAFEANTSFKETMKFLGFEDESPTAIAKSNYGEIFVFLN